jgi:hypothetical protein
MLACLPQIQSLRTNTGGYPTVGEISSAKPVGFEEIGMLANRRGNVPSPVAPGDRL